MYSVVQLFKKTKLKNKSKEQLLEATKVSLEEYYHIKSKKTKKKHGIPISKKQKINQDTRLNYKTNYKNVNKEENEENR